MHNKAYPKLGGETNPVDWNFLTKTCLKRYPPKALPIYICALILSKLAGSTFGLLDFAGFMAPKAYSSLTFNSPSQKKYATSLPYHPRFESQ